MRISTSDNYHHEYECCFAECYVDECERHYCGKHRLLWRDCESATVSLGGDRDVEGGTFETIEVGDCPECERDDRRKQFERIAAERGRAA